MLHRNIVRSIVLAGLAIAGGVLAATPDPQAEPSADARQKMAALHEQMAACLRSDKPIASCRAEMMKSCQEQLGNECHMMGHGPAGTRRMHPMGPASPDK